MNSNIDSESFGQIKSFKNLTEAEKQSGDWKPLPDGIRWQEMSPIEKVTQHIYQDSVELPTVNRHERRKRAKIAR